MPARSIPASQTIAAGVKAMPILQHVSDLVIMARKQFEQVRVHEAAAMRERGEARLIDIRDKQELKDVGTLPLAYHVSRAMLEFWADPQSPYHNIVFNTDHKLIPFCASGMRSTLPAITFVDMGMTNMIEMEGGFTEWEKQGLLVEYLDCGRPAGTAS